uniref:Uncharacterized protein n=1 Tax=Romanomermis culicivorax TaxID=13658 RepID=A0A915KAN3_ROMCU
MNVQVSIAGTAPIVTGCPKIVNVNLSHIVQGHNDYLHKISEIMKAIGVKVVPETQINSDKGEKFEKNVTNTGTNG